MLVQKKVMKLYNPHWGWMILNKVSSRDNGLNFSGGLVPLDSNSDSYFCHSSLNGNIIFSEAIVIQTSLCIEVFKMKNADLFLT